jgi:hypothetical protein
MSSDKRYLSAHDFSQYCESLNFKLEDSELEFYERAGILLPAAWLLFPDEYTAYLTDRTHSRIVGVPQTKEARPEWDQLNQLLNPDYKEPASWSDSDLYHRFDRDEHAGNPYLIRPSLESALPWEEFVVGSDWERHRYRYAEGEASRYYHRWQVYQVYELRERLHRRFEWRQSLTRFEAEGHPQDFKLDVRLPRGVYTTTTWLHYLDAVSMFRELFANEERRTFARVAERGGVRTLSEEEYEAYKRRVEDLALRVRDKYQLEEEKLYLCMVDLLNMLDQMRKSEHIKISEALTKDIRYLAELMHQASRVSEAEVAKKVEYYGGPFVGKRFRHLDKRTEILEDAKEWLDWACSDYNKEFSNMQVSYAELEKLLEFTLQEGLFLIPYTVSRTERGYNDPNAFIEPTIYGGIKNLATGVESLLRIIALRKPNNTAPVGTLYEILQAVFERTWFGEWQRTTITHPMRPKPKTVEDFVVLFYDICSDPALDKRPDLRTFALLYYARNLTSHYLATSEELYFGDLRGEVLRGVFDALLYSWAYARQQGWI